jgi:hypothetical protein
MTWHPLAAADDAFVAQAPLRIHREIAIRAVPETVWDVLSADDAVVSWSPAVTSARWATGPVRAVDCVREVTLGGLITVRERFYRWDAPWRQSFSVTHASRPGIQRFVEDYSIARTPAGSVLAWTVAIEPERLPRITNAIARPVLDQAIGAMLRAIRRQAENHQKE